MQACRNRALRALSSAIGLCFARSQTCRPILRNAAKGRDNAVLPAYRDTAPVDDLTWTGSRQIRSRDRGDPRQWPRLSMRTWTTLIDARATFPSLFISCSTANDMQRLQREPDEASHRPPGFECAQRGFQRLEDADWSHLLESLSERASPHAEDSVPASPQRWRQCPRRAKLIDDIVEQRTAKLGRN